MTVAVKTKKSNQFVYLGLFLIACFVFIYTIESLVAKKEMEPVGFTRAQIEELNSDFKRDLGEEVTILTPGTLGVEKAVINDDVLIIRFYDKGTDNTVHFPVTLICNARTQSLIVKHDLPYQDYADSYSVSDFSVRHYSKGTTTIYEADENRTRAFDTALGDRSLKEMFTYIKTLPSDDLISFVVDQPVVDNDYLTFGAAYSPLYKVSDVVDWLFDVNLDKCSNVELRQKPIYDKNA